MTKLAQAVVTKTTEAPLSEADNQSDELSRKAEKEAEIRMKLETFARELAQARAERETAK